MHPELFRIPIVDLPVHTYGVMIVTGFLLALFVAYRQAMRFGRYETDVLDFGFWALLGGMIGARVLFIIVEWRSYFIDKPFTQVGSLGIKIPSIFAVWQGGLVYWGAILGGFTAFLLYSRNKQLPTTMLLDFMIVGVPLAQAFGRMGCLAAGCCFGKPMYHVDAAGQVISDLPLAMKFPPGSLAYNTLAESGNFQMVELMEKIHSTVPLFPSQLAESFGSLCIFFILALSAPRKWFHGQVILTYAVLYSVMRSILELYRGDHGRGFVIEGVLSTSQFIAILVIIGAVVTTAMMRKLNRGYLA